MKNKTRRNQKIKHQNGGDTDSSTKTDGTTKKLRKVNCSPLVKNKKVVSTSCMTADVLLKIKDEYNKDHPDKIIATKPALIWHELKTKLDCKDERCWVNEIDNTELRNQIKTQIFSPDYPPEWIKNKKEWVSNFDIDSVMEQYEKNNKDFKYLGTTPIDYDFIVDKKTKTCVEDKLCKFNLKKLLQEGKKKFACVFNLDKHNKSGSHWVSLYIDVPQKIIMFFDSANGGISKNVKKLISAVKKQGLEENIDFKFIKNNKSHQRGGSECGIYAIHFIIEMLLQPDKSMEMFLNGSIPDKEIAKYRDVYFNKPELEKTKETKDK